MAALQVKTERNQAVEWARLFASVLVVFLHVPFPGVAGEAASCIARLAVPFFFALSGYYSVGAGEKRLKKRLLRLTKLNLLATICYFLWGCFAAVYWGGTVGDHLRANFPDLTPLWNFLVLHVNPFAGHLWYLTALMCCDAVLWLYVRFGKGREYGPLYILGIVLMTVFFLLSTVLPGKVHFYYYRNGWIMGLPVFLLGLYLGDRGRKLHISGGLLLLTAAGGVVLSILQWQFFGLTEIPVGTLIAVAALLLYLTAHPRMPSRLLGRLAGSLGAVSAAVYVVHLLMLNAYEMVLLPRFADRFGSLEPWLRPFTVLGMSLAVAVIWERLTGLGKKR